MNFSLARLGVAAGLLVAALSRDSRAQLRSERPKTRELEASAGLIRSFPASGRTNVRFQSAMLRYGAIRSRFEFLLEGTLLRSTRPSTSTSYGVSGLVRYDFGQGRVVPFVEVGVGPILTNLRVRDLSTRFEFQDRVGVGAHIFLSPRLALTVQADLYHLSNANIKRPNIGINASLFSIGLSRRF